MISLTSGNILQAETEAIVNTVNCEGYMGKGIAYQFKLEFPMNFESYALACKKELLRPGLLHIFKESGKTIVNFPTKDKWRAKSKYEFIQDGLITLKTELIERSIKSIAIPPLGCGNGGLDWGRVKELIINELQDLDSIDIQLYEPSNSYKSQPKSEPSLSLSHYLTMEIKKHLTKFSRFRLQKAAFLIDYITNSNYFKFDAHLYGPYSHSLDIVSKQILEYQGFHKIETKKAQELLAQKLQSENFYKTIKSQGIAIEKSTSLINSTLSDKEIELTTSILYVIHTRKTTTLPEITTTISDWSERKNKLFSESDIRKRTDELITLKLIKHDVLGNITKSNEFADIS